MNRQSMRVVVAPDKFKRSLTAVKVAEAIGKGLGLGARRLAQTSRAVSRRRRGGKPSDKPSASADSTQSY